jgi:glycogen operon protein
MARFPDILEPGRPDPLGATWDGLGVNFAVFSANADRMDLCVFDSSGRREIARLRMPECTDEVWHGYLPGAKPGMAYGFRAHGSYSPRNGHRFNAHKLLLDPYAKKLVGDLKWSDALFGYHVGSPRGDLSFDRRDSAAAMPKAVVTESAFNWGDDHAPNVPWSKTVIYELHVRGFSMLRNDLPSHERGTFAALADWQTIERLVKLGITAVELMPIHAFLNDHFLIKRGLTNYWGYNTLAFFAPEKAYLSDGSLTEIQTAVRRLHAAGIEVILDVVYNHTCEGNELGPTLSLRGLDHASYYRLVPGDERHLINDTGVGNTLNLSHPRVLQMVMDSMRYWVEAFHIDGFRFDLGANLGREGTGFDPGSGFFDAVRQDPMISRLKLISEPWDVGPGGYQLGSHPPGFAEWNDKYRDCVRRFWRGDTLQCPELAARLVGSGDMFDHHKRRPWASVNFVAAHDGFTLQDLVSYQMKHNEANLENDADGHAENFSANWGVEGPTDDPSVNALRQNAKRAMLATLFFSLGTPMLLAGDEAGRTQSGNNNAYCQDNEISWFDWERAALPENQELEELVARLIALRKSHPTLRSDRFLHGRNEIAPGLLDIQWFNEDGMVMEPAQWSDPERRLLALRRAAVGGGDRGEKGSIEATLMLMNASQEPSLFRVPQPALTWIVELDTHAPDRMAEMLTSEEVEVAAGSVVLLTARLDAEGVSA